jgi:NAD(P)-dependent dehydrogenase (short-subunit alcohol dehydrogenase family)
MIYTLESMTMKWTQNDIPDQTGRIAIVTGANTGIGYETARALAHKGADVTLACRSKEKGEAATQRIAAEQPSGRVTFAALDLADLDSVRSFAAAFTAKHNRLDLLVNNAGVMVPPESKTKQGFELQFGVNHLGHFALTGLLLDLLRAAPGARVVSVSSAAHRMGKMDFDDLDFTARGYKPWEAYGQSKLANLLFTFQLQRRFEAEGADVIAVAAHPGWTGTDLQRNAWYVRLMNVLVAMSPPQGALPTLRAATAPDVKGGEYYGPHGHREMRGYPVRVGTSEDAKNAQDAACLWQVSEELTGVEYVRPDEAGARYQKRRSF